MVHTDPASGERDCTVINSHGLYLFQLSLSTANLTHSTRTGSLASEENFTLVFNL